LKSKRISVPRQEAVSHLAKAEQFLRTAEVAQKDGFNDAAMLNAIHAGISAIDAVTVTLAGIRSTDPDHARAADLLDEVAAGPGEARASARQLRQLLGRKSAVEYQSKRAASGEAADAVKRARRLFDWSRGVVSQAKL
jgi:HEPN domain-containing protein